MSNRDYRADSPGQSSGIVRCCVLLKYVSPISRMLQLGVEWRCPVALDQRGVIWIKLDGQWRVLEDTRIARREA